MNGRNTEMKGKAAVQRSLSLGLYLLILTTGW